MLRKFINSEMKVIQISHFEDTVIINDNFVIQTEVVGDALIIEYCKKSLVVDLIPFGTITSQQRNITPLKDDEKAQEYCNTVLNNDPFGKYSSCTLGTIFKANDTNWIKSALKSMRNEYILERVKFLVDYFELKL